MLVQHHVKYKEIHGKDEVVMMEWGEHRALHRRLRKEGSCQIPTKELHDIAHKAYRRTEKGKAVLRNQNKSRAKYRKEHKEYLEFYTKLYTSTYLIEKIEYNNTSGHVRCTNRFKADGINNHLIIIELD